LTRCAQHIDVVKLGELLGSKGFRRPEDHVPSVVDQDVDTALLLDNGLDGGIHRRLVGYIHLDGSQIDAVLF
jgi:hypothetical protein